MCASSFCARHSCCASMTALRRNILFDLGGFALSFSAAVCYNELI